MPERFEFRIHGMDCADEVAILKREMGPLVGDSSRLSFDILRGKMYVDSPLPRRWSRRSRWTIGRIGLTRFAGAPRPTVQPASTPLDFPTR